MTRTLAYSNLLMLVIPGAVVLGNGALLGVPASWPFLVAFTAGTFALYQADRAILPSPEDSDNKPDRVRWARRHRGYVFASTAAALAVCALQLPRLRPATCAAMAALFVVGGLYAWPLWPGGPRLKAIPFAKALIVAAAWAVGTVALPVVEARKPWDATATLLLTYRALWLMPNLLLGNWYDRAGDTRAGILTFAASWTESRVRRVCVALPLIAFAAVAAAVAAGFATGLWLADAAGLLLFPVLLARNLPESASFYLVTIDLVAGWPAVTAALARTVSGLP